MDEDQVSQKTATVVVVDADASGYDGVSSLASGGRSAVRFLTTGRVALLSANRAAGSVWLIGTHLQDMSGFDLHAMIRERLSGSAVCIVASQYRVEDEIRAYQAGATMYLQKPVDAAKLAERMLRRRDTADSQSPEKEVPP